MSLDVGDVVRCYIPGNGCDADTFVVSGEMKYSTDDVFLLCSEQSIGMPCNKQWCTTIGRDEDTGARYRERYLAAYPGQLKVV